MTPENLREKVTACWMGKAIGGTLGMRFEGMDGPFDLTFYDPVLTEALANDDLDLQVVWAVALASEASPRVDRHRLAQAWRDHVPFPFNEYAYGRRNMEYGLPPPQTGRFDNWYAHGMGAAIRTELWACLAPGNPRQAAAYAYEDACVDHAGEGVWAAVFHAALEAAAFIESDRDALLDTALEFLPTESRVRKAIEATRRWWPEHRDAMLVRSLILEHYEHGDFTDVVQNLAFTVLGWLDGDGDFGRAICTAVNCGKDTDCTGATVGALMGILDPGCIDERWKQPIGDALVISPAIFDLDAPPTIGAFTDLVLSLRDRLPGDALEIPQVLPRGAPRPGAAPIHVPALVWPASLDDHPVSPDDAEKVNWPGHWIMDERIRDGLMMRFEICAVGAVRIITCTPGCVRAWLDGELVIDRPEPGPMNPSPHRVDINDLYVDVELTAEVCQLSVAVQVDAPLDPELIVIVADAKSKLHLPWALAVANDAS